MIKAILIEDEVNARSSLRKMLNLIEPSIKIVGETGYVNEAIQLINNNKPQLVFIDIQLEDGTGFDILKQLNHLSFKIIFTTAYNQYAIKAFKYSAIDYLLKPIHPEELKQALTRTILSIKKDEVTLNYVDILKHNIKEKDKKIVLKTANNQHIIYIKDIIRLQAEAAYTTFITNSGKVMVSKNLMYYQNILGPTFLRCHQSHLVNKKHVSSIHKSDFVKMINDDLVPISTRKKTEILKKIQK